MRILLCIYCNCIKTLIITPGHNDTDSCELGACFFFFFERKRKKNRKTTLPTPETVVIIGTSVICFVCNEKKTRKRNKKDPIYTRTAQ